VSVDNVDDFVNLLLLASTCEKSVIAELVDLKSLFPVNSKVFLPISPEISQAYVMFTHCFRSPSPEMARKT
jgi:hypothetical protein